MKKVVITGGTRGIGRGLALEFLKRKADVVITGRKAEEVASVVDELAAESGNLRVHGAECEITNADSLEALWRFADNALGGVDVWINNAGISIPRAPLAEQPFADLERIAAVNFTGVLLANKVAISNMRVQGHGQVWNMEGFGSGGQTAPGMAAYGGTKRAVNYLNKALQKEIQDTSVQVNTLSPGIVVTDLLVGDYDLSSPEWQKTKKILNILGDTVETVTPWLVDKILSTDGSGKTVAWLTGPKAFVRFLTAGFNKRNLFAHLEGADAATAHE